MSSRITIYAGAPLQAALRATDPEDDGNRSGRINAIADRYMAVVARSAPQLREREWYAVLDAINGTAFDTATVRALHLDVEDSPELDSKWGVDHRDLAKRLAELPYAGKLAVVEISERFWGSGGQAPEGYGEALRAAGAPVEPE